MAMAGLGGLSGWTVRGCALRDVAAILTVTRASDIAALGEPDWTEDEVVATLTAPNHDPAHDSWLAFGPDRDPLAWAYVDNPERGTRDNVEVYAVPGRGAEAYGPLLDLALARVAERARAAGHATVTLRAGAVSSERAYIEALTARGFTFRKRHARMARPLTGQERPPPQFVASAAHEVVASAPPSVVASALPQVGASGRPGVAASGRPGVVGSGRPGVVGSGRPGVVGSGPPGVVGSGPPGVVAPDSPDSFASAPPASPAAPSPDFAVASSASSVPGSRAAGSPSAGPGVAAAVTPGPVLSDAGVAGWGTAGSGVAAAVTPGPVLSDTGVAGWGTAGSGMAGAGASRGGPFLVRGVRAGDENEMRRFHEVLQSAFADTPDFQPVSYEAWREALAALPSISWDEWLVSEISGQIVGVLQSADQGVERGEGWVKNLAVLREHRRTGLGGALLHSAFAIYAAKGRTSAGLGVDLTNPTGAYRLYGDVGMAVTFAADMFERTISAAEAP